MDVGLDAFDLRFVRVRPVAECRMVLERLLLGHGPGMKCFLQCLFVLDGGEGLDLGRGGTENEALGLTVTETRGGHDAPPRNEGNQPLPLPPVHAHPSWPLGLSKSI